MFKNIVVLTLTMLLVGCVAAPQSLYHWGSYPQQNYLMYSQPEKATPSAQILKLEAELEKSKGKGLAVPPGLYAHLGLLYVQQNQLDKAAEYFQLERQVYPESTVLMNRLLQKMGNATGQGK
ncbi:hypothetical protein EC844_10116 [Acinetobacter calcoaceticus]|uniref:Uncharacterized protein n=1 Tax=Acinetobacter calcoaceticus TaxID=471 RepID=A0A4R1Y0V6_ACICA|nr:hypothetical protein EC844_10116 [Acinetobacter calcoaceticus]